MRSIGSIDHHEARVFHFSPTMWNGSCCTRIVRTKHIHNKANSIGSRYVSEDHAFSSTIVDAGGSSRYGPANTKSKLVKYISQHDPYRDSARALAQWIASACRASGLVVEACVLRVSP